MSDCLGVSIGTIFSVVARLQMMKQCTAHHELKLRVIWLLRCVHNFTRARRQVKSIEENEGFFYVYT